MSSSSRQKLKRNVETMIQAIRIYSQNIEIEFGKENVPCSCWKVEERRMTKKIQLPNQEWKQNTLIKTKLQ